MNKRIFLIVVFCALVVLCALLLNKNQIDKSALNKIIYNSQLIPLRDITNFKWDYAYLYTDNIDFQKNMTGYFPVETLKNAAPVFSLL